MSLSLMETRKLLLMRKTTNKKRKKRAVRSLRGAVVKRNDVDRFIAVIYTTQTHRLLKSNPSRIYQLKMIRFLIEEDLSMVHFIQD